MHFRQGGGGGGVNYDLYFFIDVMEGGANICQEFSTKGLIECHTQVWNVWMLILFIMPLICQGEGGGVGGIYYLFRIWTIYTYKLLQSFPQKHL